LLVEAKDLASATSSQSSKLIHGGLRYLEHYEFRLVREALAEREVLLKKAPHIMWPLRFRLPHQPHLRPAWMIQAGLFLYDHLAKREILPASRRLKLDEQSPLKAEMHTAFEYSDGWVDDARLVVLNAMQARDLGAEVRTYTACVNAKRCEHTPSDWVVTLSDSQGEHTQVKTRALVNAAGPWAIQFLDDVVAAPNKRKMRLVKGSHIVVPKIHEGDEAYILQNADGRIVFALPYEDDYTLIGTTDVNYTGDPRKATIDSDEMDYLVAITNHYFKTNIAEADVIHTFCGVRPLLEEEGANAQALSRDYEFKLSGSAQEGLLLNIFGGKITTYRKLAEQAVNQLAEYFPTATGAWTATAPLTGGDFTDQDSLQAELATAYPFIDAAVLARYVRSYGSLTRTLLANVNSKTEMGVNYGVGLYEVELRYLRDHEFATCAEDALWRRSKLGLKCDQLKIAKIESFFANALAPEDKALAQAS
jgi:glycerol-3-phosphate dehydrogenase